MSESKEDVTKIQGHPEGYLSTPPPLDGSMIRLWFPGNKTKLMAFDKSAYGGKGGWFTELNHAIKDPKFGQLWQLYLKK